MIPEDEKAPELSEKTKAEMEAGKAALKSMPEKAAAEKGQPKAKEEDDDDDDDKGGKGGKKGR